MMMNEQEQQEIQQHHDDTTSNSDGDSSISSSDDDELDQLRYKVIILGDGAVGKTSIINRFCHNNFRKQYKQTIGLDFFSGKVTLPENVEVSLQIWDIGGQAIGSKMIKNYIFGCDAVVFAYDITNFESFKNVQDWHSILLDAFKDKKMPHIALVGNKLDMAHLQSVTVERHDKLALSINASPFHISAKTGDNVNTLFYRLSAVLANISLTEEEIEATTTIIPATIVNHKQHDDEQQHMNLEKHKRKHCIIQ